MTPEKLTYKHTQIGYLAVVIIGACLVFLLAYMVFGGNNWIGLTVLLVLASCLVQFVTLTVAVGNGMLKFRFGPGIISKQYPLRSIEDCEVVKNPWYYGWGIRFTPHGWLYNVSGLWSVQVKFKNGKGLRLGTDEPEELCQAIKDLLSESD
jgi:hypothetical protein